MTLGDAARAGVTRIRLPIWANPTAYFRIQIIEHGYYAVWGRLFDRQSQEACGFPTPQSILLLGWDSDRYEPYTGLLDAADEAL